MCCIFWSCSFALIRYRMSTIGVPPLTSPDVRLPRTPEYDAIANANTRGVDHVTEWRKHAFNLFATVPLQAANSGFQSYFHDGSSGTWPRGSSNSPNSVTTSKSCEGKLPSQHPLTGGPPNPSLPQRAEQIGSSFLRMQPRTRRIRRGNSVSVNAPVRIHCGPR